MAQWISMVSFTRLNYQTLRFSDAPFHVEEPRWHQHPWSLAPRPNGTLACIILSEASFLLAYSRTMN